MEFNPGDVIHIQVTKADIKQDAGLKLEYRSQDECYYVKSIGGLFKRRETPLIVGDKLLTLNGQDMEEYEDLDDCHRAIKSEMKVMLCVERQDPDDDEPEDEVVDETGLVVREDSDDEEYEDEEGVDVQFGNGAEDGAIIPHNDDSPRATSKKIVPGELRVLDGIEANPDLNGQYVKVIEKDSEKKGRWLVELTDTEKVISVSGKKLARMNG